MFDLIADGSIQLIVSPMIMAEYEAVLPRKKFGLFESTVGSLLKSLRRLAVEIVPSEPLRVCLDPTDDKFLECAVAAGASFVVTGNLKHFPRIFSGVRIIPPAVFLREAAAGA